MEYNNLRGLIATKGMIHKEFAEKIGMSPSVFSLKLNKKRPWVKSEIDKILEELGATYEEVFGEGETNGRK